MLMTFTASVQWLVKHGFTVIESRLVQGKYYIRTNGGKSVTPAPISPLSVAVNATAWRDNPDLRPR